MAVSQGFRDKSEGSYIFYGGKAHGTIEVFVCGDVLIRI